MVLDVNHQWIKKVHQIINKRLIKALNSSSVNLDNSTTLRTKRKQKNIKTKTKTVDNKETTKLKIEFNNWKIRKRK